MQHRRRLGLVAEEPRRSRPAAPRAGACAPSRRAADAPSRMASTSRCEIAADALALGLERATLRRAAARSRLVSATYSSQNAANSAGSISRVAQARRDMRASTLARSNAAAIVAGALVARRRRSRHGSPRSCVSEAPQRGAAQQAREHVARAGARRLRSRSRLRSERALPPAAP